GPPDGRTDPSTVTIEIAPASGSDHSGPAFLTTPPSCPPAGAWSSTLTLSYDDGSTASAGSTTPCAPPATSATPPPRHNGVGRNATNCPRTRKLGARHGPRRTRHSSRCRARRRPHKRPR